MTGFAFLLVAGGSPVSRRAVPLSVQVFDAVHQGLWANPFTQEVGVTWEPQP